MVGNNQNWAGNYQYQATQWHAPTSVTDLQRIVGGAESIRAIGTRHTFNELADAAALVSLSQLPRKVMVDRAAMTAVVPAGMTYGDLASVLVREGVALRAMASLPHISVAGAIATGTHGSGDRTGNLATAVRGLELVTADGDLVSVTRNDPDFAGLVVGLGACGIVTRVTLEVEPAYEVQQQVFRHLPWETLYAHFDEVTSAATSVSLFTDYGDTVNQVWLKARVGADGPAAPREALLGAKAADRPMHPVDDLAPDNVTVQMGKPGIWAARLPHFLPDVPPASGHEIQSEYFVSRVHAVAAIQAMCGIRSHLRPVLMVSEIRTIAADNLWMSAAYGTDVVAIHLSWYPEQDAVERVLALIEDVLAPYAPRPHWGKVFLDTDGGLRARYPKAEQFRQLVQRWDPRGTFGNDFLDRHVFG